MRFFGLSVTLKWNKWVWKTGLPHFYASRNCVYNSIAVCECVCIRYNRIWFVDSSARLTLKFDGWTNISIGHLFHALRSYACHYIAICELKLRVADRKDSIVANRRFFCLCDSWHWTDGLDKQRYTSTIRPATMCAIWQPSVNSNYNYRLEKSNWSRIVDLRAVSS